VPLGEGAVAGLVEDPGEDLGRALRGQVLVGGADQQGADAAVRPLRVYVQVDVTLAGLRAVVDHADVGRADHLAVLLGDEGKVVGVGMGVSDVVGDGLRRVQDVRECQVADLGEALDVGSDFGAQLAHDDGHVAARYVDRAPGCLSFSCGAGQSARDLEDPHR
jgi:hypothetical protein